MDSIQKFTDTLIDTSNKIFDIKNKITDNEYLTIMNHLTNIRTQYTELDKTKSHGECKCVLNNNIFCYTSMKTFKECTNLMYIIGKCPVLRNIIVIDALPQDCEYTYQMFYKTDINFSLNIQFNSNNDNDNDNNNDNDNDSFVVCGKLIQYLLNLNNNIYTDFSKMFVCIAIYNYMFKNFKIFFRNNTLINTSYDKLIEFSKINTQKGVLLFNIIQKLYNINTNIFKIFLQNLEPHYIYKKVLVQFNKQEHKLKHISTPLYIKQSQYKHKMILRSHLKQ